MLDTKEEKSTKILEKKADDFIILKDFEENPACINVDKNSDQEISRVVQICSCPLKLIN